MMIYFSFKINQDYIAKNLCVEKDVKGSSCKGCCQLKKKLNENKEQKEQLPPQSINKYDFNFFQCKSSVFRFYKRGIEIKLKEISCDYYFIYSTNIFHPPRFSNVS